MGNLKKCCETNAEDLASGIVRTELSPARTIRGKRRSARRGSREIKTVAVSVGRIQENILSLEVSGGFGADNPGQHTLRRRQRGQGERAVRSVERVLIPGGEAPVRGDRQDPGRSSPPLGGSAGKPIRDCQHSLADKSRVPERGDRGCPRGRGRQGFRRGRGRDMEAGGKRRGAVEGRRGNARGNRRIIRSIADSSQKAGEEQISGKSSPSCKTITLSRKR